MKNNFVVKKNGIVSYVEAADGALVGKPFPINTKFTIDANSVIVDMTKSHKTINYKVMSYVDGRQKANFDCSEVEKLPNGNYRLKLIKSYDGEERSLIYNPEIGKPVSRAYEEMCEIKCENAFVCTLRVNKRSCRFDYRLKINYDGKIVTDVYNCKTKKTIPYEKMVSDENDTISEITEDHRQDYTVAYELAIKY